jgi:flavin reductase (DIM6/NTAB) family NADH-FMN oxidoreductase RutF
VIFYEPARRDRELLPHDPFKALVAPRPIGWISTLGPDGTPNLAPYSYFNAICDSPPLLAFSSAGRKHSAAFAGDTREFVWNLATYDLREQMNLTSAHLPDGASEFEHAGLEPAPSRLVGPPRVAASPCSMECRVVEDLQLRDVDGHRVDRYLIIGQVVGIHLDERYLADGAVDTAAMRPIARCGRRGDYAVVDRLFDMPRPD